MKPVTALIVIGGVAAVGVWYYQREKQKRIEAATRQAAEAAAGTKALVEKAFSAVSGFFSGPGSTQGPPVSVDCYNPSSDSERQYCAGIRQQAPSSEAGVLDGVWKKYDDFFFGKSAS